MVTSKTKKILIKVAVFIGLVAFGAFSYWFLTPMLERMFARDVLAMDFVSYDLARATFGANNVELMIEPGVEPHDFKPTELDFRRLKNAKLFVYNGGETESWVEALLKEDETAPGASFRIMDQVEAKIEEHMAGMLVSDDGLKYDENVWSSPSNMLKALGALKAKAQEIGLAVKEDDFSAYYENVLKLNAELLVTVEAASRRELVFGDRFPFRYLADDFGLSYFAPFSPSCWTAEADSETVAFLVAKAKEKSVPAIIMLASSSRGEVAQKIAEDAGVEVLEMYSAESISREDFDAGTTYVDLMQRNAEVLRKVLH